MTYEKSFSPNRLAREYYEEYRDAFDSGNRNAALSMSTPVVHAVLPGIFSKGSLPRFMSNMASTVEGVSAAADYLNTYKKYNRLNELYRKSKGVPNSNQVSTYKEMADTYRRGSLGELANTGLGTLGLVGVARSVFTRNKKLLYPSIGLAGLSAYGGYKNRQLKNKAENAYWSMVGTDEDIELDNLEKTSARKYRIDPSTLQYDLSTVPPEGLSDYSKYTHDPRQIYGTPAEQRARIIETNAAAKVRRRMLVKHNLKENAQWSSNATPLTLKGDLANIEARPASFGMVGRKFKQLKSMPAYQRAQLSEKDLSKSIWNRVSEESDDWGKRMRDAHPIRNVDKSYKIVRRMTPDQQALYIQGKSIKPTTTSAGNSTSSSVPPKMTSTTPIMQHGRRPTPSNKLTLVPGITSQGPHNSMDGSLNFRRLKGNNNFQGTPGASKRVNSGNFASSSVSNSNKGIKPSPKVMRRAGLAAGLAALGYGGYRYFKNRDEQ